jgi:hypothetical protein
MKNLILKIQVTKVLLEEEDTDEQAREEFVIYGCHI